MPRLVWLVLALLVIVTPAAAQTPSAADLVPAEMAAFIRLEMADVNASANDLNVMLALAGEVQPGRIQLTNALSFDALIPFASLFDVEDVTVAANVLPWLGSEIVLAYRQFDAALAVSADDVLLLLPTRDMFLAASSLQPVIEGQDRLERATYRDVTLYAGDRATIALTPTLVLVGADDLVRQALDVQAGAVEGLTASAVFQAAWGEAPDGTLVSAYVAGDYIAAAAAGLVSGGVDSEPLWAAFAQAAGALRGAPGLDTWLFGGGFDGAAVHLGFDSEEREFVAAAAFHAAQALPAASAASGSALLDWLPRAAFWVQQGDSFKDFADTVLAALPMSNFGGQLLAGLPLATIGTNSMLPTPTADDVQAAANSFLDGLQTGVGINVRADVFDRLSGAYALALLPRPNDPLPALRLPVDVLLVTPVAQADADALTENISRLLQVIFNLTPADNPDSDSPFALLTSGAEVIAQIGVLDGVLVIGTGDAAERALAAHGGDNRLTAQPIWDALHEPDAPGLYIDTAAFFNTFFPLPGGSVPSLNQRIRLGVWSAPRAVNLWELKLILTLPTA